MKFLIQLIISTLAVLISDYLLSGVEIVNNNFFTAFIVAAVLSFLNAVVKPIMVVLTIPITLISLGFFLLVINALIIMLASHLVEGFRVDGFWSALFFSLILSLVTSELKDVMSNNDDKNK
jgi:putative membrane protein